MIALRFNIELFPFRLDGRAGNLHPVASSAGPHDIRVAGVVAQQTSVLPSDATGVLYAFELVQRVEPDP